MTHRFSFHYRKLNVEKTKIKVFSQTTSYAEKSPEIELFLLKRSTKYLKPFLDSTRRFYIINQKCYEENWK